MITKIEAINYRCLKSVAVPLSRFHVLVGPNASGKTTFLDVVGFIHDVANSDIDAAVEKRTSTPEELLFNRQGNYFSLAVEADIPAHLKTEGILSDRLDLVRYELVVGFDDTHRRMEIKEEQFLFKRRDEVVIVERDFFPDCVPVRESLLTPKGVRNIRRVFKKVEGGNDNFYPEQKREKGKGGWLPSFRFGTHKSALFNLPADETKMPVALWFREFMAAGIEPFVLNSQQIRKPSPPTRMGGFLPDGSNLPWVVRQLKKDNPKRFKSWISHLRTVLTDLSDVEVVEMPENKHAFIQFVYRDGALKVPSWFVSDGSLRLVCLTLPAYLVSGLAAYLIEEPENGIHPGAVSSVIASLSNVYDSQVLLASHSPVVLNQTRPENILCFSKTSDGATDVVKGDEHPYLRKWQGETPMGDLLAAGVLS